MSAVLPDAQALDCPRCGAALSGPGSHCPACGYTLEGVRLYDPKRFVLLSMLFSAMVPVYLSASNWGRVGQARKRWLCLGLGFLGMTLLFFTLFELPDSWGAQARALGLLVNVPVGYWLGQLHRPVFATGLRLGAGRASVALGTLVGLAFVAGAIALALGGSMGAQGVWDQIRLDRGVALMKQEKHEEAIAIFDDLLRKDPENDAAVFNRALCEAALDRWTEAGEGFERYVGRNPQDPEGHAFLAFVRAHQERYAEARSHAAKARELEPRVIGRLFGMGDSLIEEMERRGPSPEEPNAPAARVAPDTTREFR